MCDHQSFVQIRDLSGVQGANGGQFQMSALYKLPDDVTCERCVLQVIFPLLATLDWQVQYVYSGIETVAMGTHNMIYKSHK